VTWVKLKLVSVRVEIVLISAQDRCTVWDEHTIGLEHHFRHSQWNSRDVGEVGACFSPFGDVINLGRR
jgi:hypothetical protein